MVEPATIEGPPPSWNRRRFHRALLGIAGLSAAGAGALAWSRWPIAPALPLKGRLEEKAARHVSRLAFSPDGGTLAAGGEHLWLHDLSTGARLRLRDDPRDASSAATSRTEDDGLLTLAIDFSPDGALLATGDHNGLVRLWESRSGALVARLDGHRRRRILSLDFAPDGRTLATAGDDWAVLGWDVASHATRWSIGRNAPAGPLYQVIPQPVGHAIGFSEDGTVLGSVNARGDAPFALWEVATERYRSYHDEPTAIWPYQLSPDARTVVAGDLDSVALWDVASGLKRVKLVAPHPDAWGGSGSSFHPEGHSLAVPWNARTRRWVASRNAADQAVLAMVGVRPGDRRDVAVHETETGRLLFFLEGQTTTAFSADGQTLATADARGRISLWDARPIRQAMSV